MKNKEWRRFAKRCLFSVLAMALCGAMGGFGGFGLIPLAHADCQLPPGAATTELALPAARIPVPRNAALGDVLGTVHATLAQDLRFTCKGQSNTRELRMLGAPVTGPGLAHVYASNVPGIGVRVTARGGSFAGIDDGPHPLPYTVTLLPHADKLTGLAVDVDFIKTAPIQDGVLAAGTLMSVVVGGVDLVDVVRPEGGIIFTTLQCAPVKAGGMVSMGTGTLGSFSQESLVLSAGCGANLTAVISEEYRSPYGRPALAAPDKPVAATKTGIFSTVTAVGSAVELRKSGGTLRAGETLSSEDATATTTGTTTSSGISALAIQGGGMNAGFVPHR